MMTLQEMTDLFERDNPSILDFNKAKGRLHKRPDLCAFLLLDKLLPGDKDMVAGAEHDQIWLDADVEELAKVASKDDIDLLMSCGVRYDNETDSLAMFA